jgi:hypothetical protein
VSDKAIDLWNATIAIPQSYNTPRNAEYDKKIQVYRDARESFTEAARKYLADLETHTPTSSIDPIKPDLLNELKK